MKYIILLLIIFFIFYFLNNYINFSNLEFFSDYVNPFYKDKTFCNASGDDGSWWLRSIGVIAGVYQLSIDYI